MILLWLFLLLDEIQYAKAILKSSLWTEKAKNKVKTTTTKKKKMLTVQRNIREPPGGR